MKFIELFAGIGGFRLGLERAGHKCIWANEWLEKPRRIYAKQFGEKPDGRDIRTIRADDIPEADFICGGFPCATFSIAGKRAGFSLEDTRGTLAFEMFRLARDKGIPYIFFENVKGLLNHDNGRTFGIILEVLDGMGYDSQWELIDSQNFGVPQHRERVFLIANFRGKPRPKVFPITEPATNDIKSKEIQRKKIFGTLQARMRKGLGNTESRITSVLIDPENCEKITSLDEILVSQWRRGWFRDYKSSGTPTLTANMGTGGHNVPFIMPAQAQSGKSIRKLTPLECERLQGLPDNYTQWLLMDDGVIKQNSNADRYERCGRTVTIPVIEAIGRKFGYDWY